MGFPLLDRPKTARVKIEQKNCAFFVPKIS